MAEPVEVTVDIFNHFPNRARRANAVLQMYHCGCGAKKKRGAVMCQPCFNKLTPELKAELIKMLRPEFVDALEAAIKSLGNNFPAYVRNLKGPIELSESTAKEAEGHA